MHEFDEGLDSFRSRSVLQKSWTNSVISTPTGRFASSGMALSTTIWRFAGPGTAFWAPWQVLLALERRFESQRSQKHSLRSFHVPRPRPGIYG